MNKAHFILVSLLFIIMFIFAFSCKKSENVDEQWYLSGADSLIIVNEIILLTDNWAKSNSNMNTNEATQFWDSSPQMIFIENAEKFANRDSVYSVLKSWFIPTLESFDVKWNHRDILPLSKNTAHFFGNFSFHAKYNSGEILNGNSFFTGLLLKKNNKWKMYRGHESYKMLNE